eukprot:TRINITY_DN10060_c0_g1_i1.p1 TRINITY_DN10060_c0_g1~~TRINITY_DN10060_c0_g1_i1.p1  ORF type:complete len:190 (+),score=25.29 TRINITY_DN10060_c0_g1_i1:112-681(+)
MRTGAILRVLLCLVTLSSLVCSQITGDDTTGAAVGSTGAQAGLSTTGARPTSGQALAAGTTARTATGPATTAAGPTNATTTAGPAAAAAPAPVDQGVAVGLAFATMAFIIGLGLAIVFFFYRDPPKGDALARARYHHKHGVSLLSPDGARLLQESKGGRADLPKAPAPSEPPAVAPAPAAAELVPLENV